MVGSGLRDEGRRELGTAQAPKASGRFCWCCRRWLLGYGESSMRPQRHIFWMQFVMAALHGAAGLLGWVRCSRASRSRVAGCCHTRLLRLSPVSGATNPIPAPTPAWMAARKTKNQK